MAYLYGVVHGRGEYPTSRERAGTADDVGNGECMVGERAIWHGKLILCRVVHQPRERKAQQEKRSELNTELALRWTRH